ncbi:hypothetical protein GCM10025860_14790 [Methanobacterium ferruginis]|nr:hypothetical protein GCM10025860_14790 [Methanobacterium ferruginis]
MLAAAFAGIEPVDVGYFGEVPYFHLYIIILTIEFNTFFNPDYTTFYNPDNLLF